MAFKLIPLEATGSYQSFLARVIEDPTVIDLTDTPTSNMPNGVPQTEETIDGYITGSAKSLLFDGADDYVFLPSIGPYMERSNINLAEIGSSVFTPGKPTHGVSATNISVDTWIKVTEANSGLNMPGTTQKASKMFEFSVQRHDDINVDTFGIDGRYTGRLIYTDDPNELPGVSGHFLELIYTSTNEIAYSLTSSNPLESTAGDWLGTPSGGVTGWNHVCLIYEGGAAPDNGGDTSIAPNDTKMKIYINGDLDREATIYDLDNSFYDANSPFPTKVDPFSLDQPRSFPGRIDELRLMTATGAASVYPKLAARGNIGRAFDSFSAIDDPDIVDAFTPTSNHVAGWWRFESVSGIDLFSQTPQSIEDSTNYEHHGTPQYFEGSISYAEDLVVVMGLNTNGNLSKTDGGTVDHGGQLLITPLNETIRIETGVMNLVNDAANVWVTTGGDSTVNDEDTNIYFGSGAIRVNTGTPFSGARHNIVSDLLFDENEYTMHIKLLHLTGSNSAKVSFTLGESTNTLSTTAVMERGIWESVYLTHKNVDPSALKTGAIDVVSLSDTNEGSLFLVDGLMITQGREPSFFTRPETVRYSGEVNWGIRD